MTARAFIFHGFLAAGMWGEKLSSTIMGALIFFIVLPLVFSRIFGWRGTKAQIGLVVIAGLYWFFSWYLD